jgi:hypothetical protein
VRLGQQWFRNANSRIKMEQIVEDKRPRQDARRITERWPDAMPGSIGGSCMPGREVVCDQVLLEHFKPPRATSCTRLLGTISRPCATGSLALDGGGSTSAVGIHALRCLEIKFSGYIPLQLTGAWTFA